MANHFSILAWEILWTEAPGRLQSLGLQELDPTETKPLLPSYSGILPDAIGARMHIGIDIYALLCIDQITENLLWIPGNPLSALCDLSGQEIQKSGDVCSHTADSLYCTAETNSIGNQLYSSKFEKNEQTKKNRFGPCSLLQEEKIFKQIIAMESSRCYRRKA